MPTKVDDVCSEVLAMHEEWDLIEALLGGTRTMRSAGKRYLPKNPLEEETDYTARLAKTTLYPAFSETVSSLTGRVFAQEMTIGKDVPDWIKKEVLDDVDLEGNKLHVFCRTHFNRGMTHGLCHVLIDSPITEAKTKQEQAANKIRPYCILIEPRRLLGYKKNAKGELTQLRLMFWREVEDGEFGTATVEQIRVYEIGKVRFFEKDEKTKEWLQTEEHAMAVPKIPFVTFYAKRKGFMSAEPPLRELAYLNQKHWSMQSDNDDLVHTASVPILCTIGIDEGTIAVGAKTAIKVPIDGDVKYVEHTGAAINAGRQALNSLKEEMSDSGAKLLRQGEGTKTATQAGEDAARENSQLGGMTQDYDDCAGQILDMIAMWRSEEDGGSAETEPNLDPDFAPTESFAQLVSMYNSGTLSAETLFNEAKRRGFITDDVEWSAEQVRILDAMAKEMELAAELNPPPAPGDPNADPNTDPNAKPQPSNKKPPIPAKEKA